MRLALQKLHSDGPASGSSTPSPAHSSHLATGCAGTFTPADLEALLDAYGEVVEYVERDGSMRITGTAAPDWAASDDGVPREAHSEDRDLRLHALEAQREELRRRMMPEQVCSRRRG